MATSSSTEPDGSIQTKRLFSWAPSGTFSKKTFRNAPAESSVSDVKKSRAPSVMTRQQAPPAADAPDVVEGVLDRREQADDDDEEGQDADDAGGARARVGDEIV